MNKTEKNKVTMYYAVNAVLFNHQRTIDSFPPLAASVTSFRHYLNEIMERAQEVAGSVGVVAEKNNALDEMTERACQISSALYSLGKRTCKAEINGVTKLSFSEICRLSEIELVQYCSRILTHAQMNADALVSYTITAEMISALEQSIETYRHFECFQDAGIAGSRAAREVLSNLFADADELLREDLDTMVELLKNNNNNFYNQYNAARTIRDNGDSNKMKVNRMDTIAFENEVAMVVAQ